MNDELLKLLRECTAEQNGEKTLWCQAADAIEKLQKDLERSKDFESFWQYEAEEALKKFQVAMRRKRGKWIPSKEPPWLDCSECGQGSVEYTNFCPNCGARMDGE